MYLPIKVELGDLVNEFNLSSENVSQLTNRIVTDVANEFLSALESNVRNTLRGTRDLYLNNIEVKATAYNEREIILHGWLPNALEDGLPPFDMKPGFSQSSKVQFNKDGGWYLRIPFNYGTPQSLSEGITKIPAPVYNIVKKQNTPLKQSQIPQPYNIPKTREAIVGQGGSIIFPAYTHKSSIFKGLQKTNSGYQTIRTVGSNSDPNAFIHKGIQANNFFESSIRDIETTIPIVTENALNEFLSKLDI